MIITTINDNNGDESKKIIFTLLPQKTSNDFALRQNCSLNGPKEMYIYAGTLAH